MRDTFMGHKEEIRRILTSPERRVFRKLSTPRKIQDYLDGLPINFELSGESNYSPRRVLSAKKAHCLEGAVFAAAVLAYHGRKPFLMDFRTTPKDDDHVVAPFVEKGLWGAISKTNHAILRWRDPIYRSPRELAMSYFHEYLEWDGRKSLREYSAPFDLTRYAPHEWVIAEEDLDWLVEALDEARHFPIAPKKILRQTRRADAIQLCAMKLTEWKKPYK
ncbi:MAG: hypothetical protein RLZZ416_407 [Candidatus Parcubacteria bacterium]